MRAGKKLGLWSGVGLTMSDMVGVGVLTTAGFMALDLSPKLILLEWVVGGLIALAGSLAYAALVRLVPRSGGEYRYLSTLLHPAVGYVAGWTSLLVGFSVPVALASLGAGAFANTLVPSLDPRIVAAAVIAVVTALHAGSLQASKWAQDGLAVVKGLLLAAFVLIGLVVGTNAIPPWTPPAEATGFPTVPFFTSLIFVSFCYTGWNAPTYAAEEFEVPRRDVPRSMLIGCLSVMGIYVLVNWVFVTNLGQADMASWIAGDTDRITLAHLVMRNLVGAGAAAVMSGVIVVALMSAVSAMTLIGPRVYAAMAADGFLPSALVAREGKPPAWSVLMQGALATSLVFLSGFRELLNNVGSILAVVSAVTMLSLFRRVHWTPDTRPSLLALVGALVYAGMSGWMVYFAMKSSDKTSLFGFTVPVLLTWMIGIVAIAMGAYAATRALRRDAVS
jgi:APA family basic amino acid/polyamine antiporter